MDIDKFNEFFDEANNNLHKSIDGERYLDAAEYRDLIIELKAKRDEKQ